MTASPDQVIAQIREALEAGPTLGPWETAQDRERPQIFHVVGPSDVVCGLDGICSPHRGNDRTFREDAANMCMIAACNPQNIAVLLAERDALLKAAEEVIDRWDTPAWKDVEPTAAVINRLRARLHARTLSGDKS